MTPRLGGWKPHPCPRSAQPRPRRGISSTERPVDIGPDHGADKGVGVDHEVATYGRNCRPRPDESAVSGGDAMDGSSVIGNGTVKPKRSRRQHQCDMGEQEGRRKRASRSQPSLGKRWGFQKETNCCARPALKAAGCEKNTSQRPRESSSDRSPMVCGSRSAARGLPISGAGAVTTAGVGRSSTGRVMGDLSEPVAMC